MPLDSIKYRGFLSYSHKDATVAERLHRALEQFAIDKDLAGRVTALGPVPRALRPIFRDRNDFSGGHSLTSATRDAIDQSAALIVLCSPQSATSSYVDEETRLFRYRHPERPVIPVVVGGTAPDCFVPALKAEIAADGSLSDRPVTLLGPDLRESGDGWTLGLAKVVAGLTGLAADDIFRRAERARRRQGRIRAAIAVAVLLIAAGGGLFAWLNHQKQQTLAEIEALVARYSGISSAEASPGGGSGLADAIKAIAEGAVSDPRYEEALRLLQEGKPKDAEPLLAAVAEEKKSRAATEAKAAAAAYRDLAAIKRVSDPASAREAYAEAARLDPDHVGGMRQHCWSQYKARNLHEAERACRRVIAIAASGLDDIDLIWAHFNLGDTFREGGDLQEAAQSFATAMSIVERLVELDPTNLKWQRNLAVAHNKVGTIQRHQGNLAGALTAYRAGLAIVQRSAEENPEDTDAQDGLFVSHNMIGDVLRRQGDLTGALEAYRAAVQVAQRLATSDPENSSWQRNVADGNERVGNVLFEQDDVDAAEDAYRISIGIREKLASLDPDNADWQRNLAISHSKIGDILESDGQLANALASYRRSLGIVTAYASSDPTNANAQRDLSIPHQLIGEILEEQGDLQGALASQTTTLEIRGRLAKEDPKNTEWQRDLSISHARVGSVLEQQGRIDEAIAQYRNALEISEQLVKLDPTNTQWQSDLERFRERLVELKPP